VAFGNSFDENERMLACGYKNGDLKIFDLRKSETIKEINIKDGISHLEFQRKEKEFTKLVCGTSAGNLEIFKDEMKKFEVSKSTIWCVSHIPQDPNFLISSDGSGQISFCQQFSFISIKTQ
jgi:WD repeat-containing protein 92